VPASCMPSPESPAKRMVTESRSSTADFRPPGRGPAAGFKTVMKNHPLRRVRNTYKSGPFGALGHRRGVRRLIKNRRRKMLHHVVDDTFNGKHADGPAFLVHDRQVAVAALLHAADRYRDRVLGLHRDGVSGHKLAHGQS